MDAGSEELFDAAIKAQDILLKTQTVFPFTLFPDTLTIDREKITLANRFFFRVAKVNSTPINDITSVEANIGPFFGSLTITSQFFVNNQRVIKFLTREDAVKIRSLLQGFIIAKQKEIDCSKIEKVELVTMLTQLGRGATD